MRLIENHGNVIYTLCNLFFLLHLAVIYSSSLTKDGNIPSKKKDGNINKWVGFGLRIYLKKTIRQYNTRCMIKKRENRYRLLMPFFSTIPFIDLLLQEFIVLCSLSS